MADLHRIPKKQLDTESMIEGEDAALLGSGSAADGEVLTADGAGNTSFDAPAAHAASHSDAGADEVTVQNLGSTGANVGEVLTADGAGGLSFAAPPADMFIRTVGGTGADFAFDDLDGALAAFEVSSSKECILRIGAAGVIADGSPVTITKGPVTFKGTVEDASVAVSGANAITFNLPDTDQAPVTFEDCDVFKSPGDDKWFFTQSGVLRLINCIITNISGEDDGLFKQVATNGILKVFARNCTFASERDGASESPIFLSQATSGTGLEFHLDNCVYVRDAALPSQFAKCTAANVDFVLENHTVLFGPRIQTSTFSIKYDGTSLMVDDKNNTGTATVTGEAAYSTHMDVLTGVDIEIFESFEADARSFVGTILHILPGQYTWPTSAASNITNQSGRTVYGDGKETQINFTNAFTGDRLNISTGSDDFTFRGIFFNLTQSLGSNQTLINVATVDRINFDECFFNNTASNSGEFFITLTSSADNCVIKDCEFDSPADLIEGVSLNDTTRTFVYNNQFIGSGLSIGLRLGAASVNCYVFGNWFERRNGSSGTTSIDVIANANGNVVANNCCRLGSLSVPSIRIDVGADDNRFIGNYGEHGQSQGDRLTIGFTGASGLDQSNVNDVWEPALMGKIATLLVGEGEMWGALGQALQHTQELHHRSYGEVFVFVTGTVVMGTFGGDILRNHTFIGLNANAKIQWSGVSKGVEYLGASGDKQRLTFIDLEMERAGATSGQFNGGPGVDMEIQFINCLVNNTSSHGSPLFDCEEKLTVRAENTEFINSNAAGIIFRSNDVTTQQEYTFKNCVATTANNVGNLIEHINGTPATALIRIVEHTDFADVPVDLSTGIVTIHHDGTGRWDETSLTSGTITRTGHQFSTDEVATGTSWIDGSEIFRRVIDTGALPNATSTSTAHSITGLDKIIFIRAFAEDTGGNQIPLPHNDSAAISNGDVGIHVDDTNVVIDAVGDASAFDESHAELWYTKT